MSESGMFPASLCDEAIRTETRRQFWARSPWRA